MESCISEEQAQHGPIEDPPPGKDAPSEETPPPGEDEPIEDAPPGKDAASGEDAPPDKVAPPGEDEPMEDAPPSKVDESEAEGDLNPDYVPGKDASSEEDAPPRKVARSQEDAPSRKLTRSQKGAPPGNDAPSGEIQDQADESEADTEGESDVDFAVESDDSSSSSSCPDFDTEDGEDEQNPESGWTSRNGQVWLPTNAETHRYVPSDKGLTPGPTQYAISTIDSLESSFDLFLTPEIIDIIVNMTNLNGKCAKGPKWQDVDVTDVKAYIGLLILAGVYRSKGEPYSSLWKDRTGRAIFRATMSYAKFNRINSTLQFEDKDGSGCLGEDKLAPIRVIWDMWTQRLPLLFNPGKDVCVDEQLVPFKGQCEFKQYIRNNPAKYGLKMWVAADVATLYTWKCQIYTGMDLDDTGDFSQAERVVLKMMENIQRVTVTCDNVFTTYSLVQELLKRKVAMVGAIKKNKPELPPMLVQEMWRYLQSSIFAFNKTTTAVSYIPKPRKNLVILSSRHRDGAMSNDDNKKPVIVTYYNRCKGAVDNLDQALRTYSCRRKTSHWPQALFFNMIDVSAFNSFVIYTTLNPNWNRSKTNRRRLFLEELGKKLVSGERMRRVAAPMVQELQSTEAAPITDLPTNSSRKKRVWCWMCPRKYRKVDNCCIKCTKYTCKEHVVLCCRSCWLNATTS